MQSVGSVEYLLPSHEIDGVPTTATAYVNYIIVQTERRQVHNYTDMNPFI